MYNFTSKVAVITGATSGIGEATAKLFAENGATVILVGRNMDKGEKLAKKIRDKGGKAEYFCADVSNLHDMESLAIFIKSNYKKIDILFNNAGVMLPSAEIEKMDVDDWKKTFGINLDGLFYITKSLKSVIVENKGCIINNASIAGMHSYVTGRSYAYSASKAAVIQYSRQMAKNYAEFGVRVNCICPGIIDTPILGDRDRKAYAERIPLGYVGRPIDVAKVVAFLASEDAEYITGVVLPVDGGVAL